MSTILDAHARAFAKNWSGSGSWLDESGNGHHATLPGGTNNPTKYDHDETQAGNYFRGPGLSGNKLTIADSAAISITGDLEFRVDISKDWAEIDNVFSKVKFWGTEESYHAELVDTTPKFWWSADGAMPHNVAAASTPLTGLSAGDRIHVRLTFDVDDGAGDTAATWYWRNVAAAAANALDSDDNWTQLGSVVTFGATTSIYDGTMDLNMMHPSGGSYKPLNGNMHRFMLYDGIGGTIVVDTNAATLDGDTVAQAGSFTEDSASAHTVTVNQSGTAELLRIVDRPHAWHDTDDYFVVANHADLNFALTDDFTIGLGLRGYASTMDRPLSKRTTGAGYMFYKATDPVIYTNDTSSNFTQDGSPTYTQRAAATIIGVREAEVDLEYFANGVGSGTPTPDASTATLTNTVDLTIGKHLSVYFQGEIWSWAVARVAFTSGEVGTGSGTLHYSLLNQVANKTVTGSIAVTEGPDTSNASGTVTAGSGVAVTVADVAQVYRPRTMLIADRLKERSLARFTVDDLPAAQVFSRGQQVTITENDVVKFKGFLMDPDQARQGPAGELVWQLRAVDNAYLVEKRRVASAFVDRTTRQIVLTLLEDYFAAEGVVAWSRQWCECGSGQYVTSDYATAVTSQKLTIEGKLRAADYSPGSDQTLASQWVESGNLRNHKVRLTSASKLAVDLSYDGSSTGDTGLSSVAVTVNVPGLTDGTTDLWWRIERDGTDVTFETSEDGVTWLALGDTQTVAATALYASTAAFKVGAHNTSASAFVGDHGYVKWSKADVVIASPTFETYYRMSDAAFEWDEGDTVALDEQGNTWTITGGSIERTWTVEADTLATTIVFDYLPGGQVLDMLSERTAYWWHIDADRILHMRLRGTNPISGTLDAGDILPVPRPLVVERSANYRNQQYVKGGIDLTSSQVEEQIGDGLKIAFLVGYPIHSVPTVETNIAAGGYVAKTVGIRGIDTGKDWYWNKGATEITQDTGGTPLNAADTIKVTYIGEFPMVIKLFDPAAVTAMAAIDGSSGIVESVLVDASLDDRNDGFDLAQAYIEQYGTLPKIFTFYTTASQWAVLGGLLTVNIPTLGFTNEELLITQVERTHIVTTNLVYKIRAVQGPANHSWAAYFRWLISGDGFSAESADVGTVAQIAQFAETTTITENVTITVFTCEVPSTTLYPDVSTLFPC